MEIDTGAANSVISVNTHLHNCGPITNTLCEANQCYTKDLQWCVSDELKTLLDSHSAVLKPDPGLVTGTATKIHIDPSAPPRFFKAIPVPYALQDCVDKEIECLEQTTSKTF